MAPNCCMLLEEILAIAGMVYSNFQVIVSTTYLRKNKHFLVKEQILESFGDRRQTSYPVYSRKYV